MEIEAILSEIRHPNSEMLLLLMRHGDAEYPSGGGSDASRRLTDWGKLQAEMMARVIRNARCELDAIVSSPYKRAVETASIVAQTLGKSASLASSSLLTPAADNESMMTVLHDHRDAEGLLLVGHMPSIGAFAGELVGEHCTIEFPTAAVAAIRLETIRPGVRGSLVWLITPDLLRE